MASYRSLRDFDWTMFILAFTICGMGVLKSTAPPAKPDGAMPGGSRSSLSGCGLLMWMITLIDYHSLLSTLSPPLCAVVTLIATCSWSEPVFGSTRWIRCPAAFTSRCRNSLNWF